MPKETTRGQRIDLVLVKGKTFERFCSSTGVYRDASGSELRVPLDLTRGVLRAQARRKLSDEQPTIVFSADAYDTVNSIWRLFADAGRLTAIPGGRDEDDPRSFYERWDCEFAYDDGRVIEVCWGELYVLNEATR